MKNTKNKKKHINRSELRALKKKWKPLLIGCWDSGLEYYDHVNSFEIKPDLSITCFRGGGQALEYEGIGKVQITRNGLIFNWEEIFRKFIFNKKILATNIKRNFQYPLVNIKTPITFPENKLCEGAGKTFTRSLKFITDPLEGLSKTGAITLYENIRILQLKDRNDENDDDITLFYSK